MVVLLVAAASTMAAAECPHFDPTGTTSDGEAHPQCVIQHQNVTHVTMACSMQRYLLGTTIERVLTTSCGVTDRRVVTGVSDTCSFQETFERPAACAAEDSKIEVSLSVVWETVGGTIIHDAGIHGSVSTPRMKTATSPYIAAWSLNIDGTFQVSTTVIPGPWITHYQGGPTGRRYNLQTVYNYPEAVSHAVVDGETLVWSDEVCNEVTCQKTASFVPKTACSDEEQAAGFQKVHVDVRSTQVCGEEDAHLFRCVLGRTSVSYWSETVSVPCEPLPLPPHTDTFRVKAALDAVASSDKLVQGSFTMENTEGQAFYSLLRHLEVHVFPAVEAQTPLAEVLALPTQNFTLVQDNAATPHATAWHWLHDGSRKKVHSAAFSLPLHDDAYGLKLLLGQKLYVEVKGYLEFANRRILATLKPEQRRMLQRLDSMRRSLNAAPSSVALSSRLVVTSDGVAVCTNADCTPEPRCSNVFTCNKLPFIVAGAGFVVAAAAFVAFRQRKKKATEDAQSSSPAQTDNQC